MIRLNEDFGESKRIRDEFEPRLTVIKKNLEQLTKLHQIRLQSGIRDELTFGYFIDTQILNGLLVALVKPSELDRLMKLYNLQIKEISRINFKNHNRVDVEHLYEAKAIILELCNMTYATIDEFRWMIDRLLEIATTRVK